MPYRMRLLGQAALALALAGASSPLVGWQAAPDRKALTTALIAAIQQGDATAVRRLLDQGARPHAREIVRTKPSLTDRTEGNREVPGDTALMVATRAGHIGIVRLLLARGADANGRGVAGYTPLITAVTNRRTDIATLLLAYGADPNLRNDYGDTALVFAANERHAQLVDLLLTHGADVNGGTGETPLMEAASNGATDVVKLLLRKKADPNVRRPGSLTALECALTEGNDEIAALIRKAGGKGRSRDVLRREQAQAERAWQQAQKKAQAAQHKHSPRPALTSEDQAILETVLRDVLTCPEDEMPRVPHTGQQIVLIDKSAGGAGLQMDDQMNAELDDTQANDISLEMRKSLLHRNAQSVSLSAFQTDDRRIRLGNVRWTSGWFFEFEKQYPQARCWVKAYLPGYTKAHDRAVLRFWIGPTPHGANGTYLLIREGGAWRVKWRHFAFYV